MRTKQIAILLAAVGVAILLSEWGGVADRLARMGTETGARPKKIVAWSNSGSPEFELRRAREFERRHPDTQVTLYFRVSSRLSDTLFVAFLSGSPPDLMSVTLTEAPDMVANGMLRPVDDLLERTLRQDPDFVEDRIGGEQELAYFTLNPNHPALARNDDGSFVDPLRAARLIHMDGKLLGFTGTTGIQTLTYNKRVFRNAAKMFPNAGLVDDEGNVIPPRTWAELLEKARIITEYGERSGEGCYGIVIQGKEPRDFMRGLEPLAATAGSRGFDFTGARWVEGMERPVGRFDYDHPGMVAAFKLMMMLKTQGSVLPGTSSREFEDSRVAVAEGRAAMLIDGWHSALIAVERVPWAANDIGSAVVPVPYQLDQPDTEQQKQEIQQILGMEVGRGRSPRGEGSATTAITSGASHPWATWQWMNSGMDEAVLKQNARRGGLPGSRSAAARIDDPDWFPFPFQKQAWAAYETYQFWPQAPDRPKVNRDFQDVLRGMFIERAPEGEEALEAVISDAQEELAAYTEDVNRELAERIEQGLELPERWTFPDWDPLKPTQAYDRQRKAAEDPEHAATVAELQSALPENLQEVDVYGEFYEFETSATAWQLIWIPTMLAGIVGLFIIVVGYHGMRGVGAGIRATLAEARQKWWAYTFVLPGMLLLITFVLFPSLYQFYLAAHSGNGIGSLRYVGMEHFQRIFSFGGEDWDMPFWTKVLPNTVIYMLIVTAGQISIGLVVASLLNLPLAAARWARPLFFIPLAVSLAAVAIVFLGLLGGPDSAINGMLDSLGLSNLPAWLGLTKPGEVHDWLGSPETDLYTVIGVAIWHGLPYNIILLLAGLQSIDPQLYEAAKVDGAGAGQRFFHITIPELLPILVIIIFNALVSAARAFGPVFILTYGGTEHSSEVVSTYIYKWGFTKPPDQQPDIGYASALGIVYATMLALILFVNVWIIAKRWKRRVRQQHEKSPVTKPAGAVVAGTTAEADADV